MKSAARLALTAEGLPSPVHTVGTQEMTAEGMKVSNDCPGEEGQEKVSPGEHGTMNKPDSVTDAEPRGSDPAIPHLLGKFYLSPPDLQAPHTLFLTY